MTDNYITEQLNNPYQLKSYLGLNKGFNYDIQTGYIADPEMRQYFNIDKNTEVAYLHAKQDFNIQLDDNHVQTIKQGSFSGPLVLSSYSDFRHKQLADLAKLTQNVNYQQPAFWLDQNSMMKGSFSIPIRDVYLDHSLVISQDNDLKTVEDNRKLQKGHFVGYNPLANSYLSNVQIGKNAPSNNVNWIFASSLKNVAIDGQSRYNIMSSNIENSSLTGDNKITGSYLLFAKLQTNNNLKNVLLTQTNHLPVEINNSDLTNVHLIPLTKESLAINPNLSKEQVDQKVHFKINNIKLDDGRKYFVNQATNLTKYDKNYNPRKMLFNDFNKN